MEQASTGGASKPLSPRALNRATLARQLLLERSDLSPLEALHHLVGLQAQSPQSWYVGLWSRLNGFDPQTASQLLEERALVRIALMRAEVHVVTADDCAVLQPVMRATSLAEFEQSWAERLKSVDREVFVQRAGEVFAEGALTYPEIGERLLEIFSDASPTSLMQAARLLLPLVQTPPRGLWNASGPLAHTTAEAWLGRSLGPAIAAPQLVKRYLAAFGPATLPDLEAWAGLPGLGAALEGLRSELVVLRDPFGREYFDVPDAPRPDSSTPAPVRFLHNRDNLLHAYADNSRVTNAEIFAQLPSPGDYQGGAVLVDGIVCAVWRLMDSGASAYLSVAALTGLSDDDAEAIVAEGRALLAVLEPRAERGVLVAGMQSA